MNRKMDSTEYEKALFEKLLYEFPPPIFEVIHDLKVTGKYSRGERQIDVAVRRAGQSHPFLAAEAKRHTRKIEIEYIDAFVTKLKEVDAKIGIMVTSSDYSAPGKKLAESLGIELWIMSIDEALEMQWRPVARQIFPWDWAFHPAIAAGLYRLQKKNKPQTVIDAIEEVPFEEWEVLVKYALENHPSEATNFLRFIALHHYDNGWRFNAVQQLIDFGALDRFGIQLLLSQESDPEIMELLRGGSP